MEGRSGKTVYDDNLLNINEDGIIFTKKELVDAEIPENSIIVFYSEYLVRNTYAVVVDSERTLNRFLTDYGFTVVAVDSPRQIHYLQLIKQITTSVKHYWDGSQQIRAYASPVDGKIACILVERDGRYMGVAIYQE